MKKALSRHFVLFGVFFLVIALGSALLYNLLRFSAAQGEASRIPSGVADANLLIHGVKQSFEKTAIFFGLMNNAKEFGASGAVSAAVISAATDADPSNDPAPKMDVTDGALNFAVSRCKTVGTSDSIIRKRMPFLSYSDANFRLGTAPKKYTLVHVAEYTETLDDVVRGDYSLSALFSVFMLNEGTVDVTVCQNANCIVVPPITESGTKIISLGNAIVTNSVDNITIEFTGSSVDVAQIRELAVSIYDKDVVDSLNAALNTNIKSYSKKATSLKIDPISAYFAPAGAGVHNNLDSGEGFLRGVAYGTDKISASTNLKSWNLAEGDAQIRYWRMYWASKFFVDNYEAWLKPRIYNRLNMFTDHQLPSNTPGCGSGRLNYNNGCPPDPTPSYTTVDFWLLLSSGFELFAADLTTEFDNAGADISWKIGIPSPLGSSFQTCTVNQNPAANQVEWCDSQNLEYYRYKSGVAVNTNGCATTSIKPCPSGEVGLTDSCQTANTCYMHYDSRYVLKNIPINVTLIDKKYTYFDTVEKKWVPYQFTFFVEIDRVDDNDCDSFSHVCSTQSGGASGAQTEPPIVVPPSLLYTCENTAGQTCEAAAGCPVGKMVAAGTCDGGKLCCKPAPAGLTCADNGGTCYLLGTCPEGENEVLKATISDCQEPAKICCKVGAPPPPTCDLVDAFMGGCPIGMVSCSEDCVDMPLMNKVCCTAA